MKERMKIDLIRNSINMLCQLLLISSISLLFKLTYAYRTCSKESNPTNYLFLNISSQLKIPLIPMNCFLCQTAHQVDIRRSRISMTIERMF